MLNEVGALHIHSGGRQLCRDWGFSSIAELASRRFFFLLYIYIYIYIYIFFFGKEQSDVAAFRYVFSTKVMREV